MLCLATPTAPRFLLNVDSQGTERKANRMTGKASRATHDLRELQGNASPSSSGESFRRESPDSILDLDDDAFSVELKKHTEKGFKNGSYYFRLTNEGARLASERHERRDKPIRDAWRPDDISEADQYTEPLRTVVAFRLLCGQYVAIAGISMDSLREHWKRSKLCDAFSPMADDVAAAMVATNEDPKGLFRALSFCNETDQMRFVDAWRGEILPTLKTVEIKLKNSIKGTATTSGEANATDEHTEADSAAVAGNNGTEQPEADKWASLKPCWRKAYSSKQYAEEQKGEPLTDREAWEYLNEYGIGDDGNELESYKPPLPDTYADYMNKARRGLGEPKYTPRGGRAAGARSVQKRSEI